MESSATGIRDDSSGHCCGPMCPGLLRARWFKSARMVLPQIQRVRAEHAARTAIAHRRRSVLLWGKPIVVASFWQTQASVALSKVTKERSN